MRIKEINNLTLEITIPTLLDRLLDFSLTPAGELPYTMIDDDTLSVFNRIFMHVKFTKPT